MKDANGWEPIRTAPVRKTVLTQHVDDLYPVAAFRAEKCGPWFREFEGPEDDENPPPGKYDRLYREPTHWRPLPAGPVKKEK